MVPGARQALFALSLACFSAPNSCIAADPQWVKARLGSFETISDSGRRSAIQALSQFEQFRFALGAAMGKPDLRLDPPLRIMVFKTAQEMPPGCDTVHTGRDRLMACVVDPGKDAQLPAALIRELTVRLLDENFTNLPAPMERALETFFSTVQSNAVHVIWGTPPPREERTREWAFIHRLITQPDYAGRAHIFLHNLAEGMDANGAIRSLSEEPAKFNAEIDRYYSAGVFNSAVAPNRPLNPDRDFTTTNLTSDEGQLARADLLTPGSAAIYKALIQSGKQVPEANEGLAMLALRDGDKEQARHYMEAARSAGTRNVVALTKYAASLDDAERAQEILKEALTIDPKYPEAHWELGVKVDEPRRRMGEWKQATALAPRNYVWWAKYAQLCQDQKQYAEAGRAWLAAAQAAPDMDHKESYLASRGRIDDLRLNDEEAERRQAAAAKAAEIDRLKAQARKEIADMEARANTRPLSKSDLANTVDYTEINGPESTLAGTLTRVQCLNRQVQLEVKDEIGKVQKLLIPDPSRISILGGDGTLVCGGAQKPRSVSITYRPLTDKKGFTGEVTGIEFR